MNSSGSIIFLWLLAGVNLVAGGVIRVAQSEELESRSPEPDAVAWSAIGLDLMSFGILVAVIALATQAIVGAIAEAGRGK